MPRQKQFHGSKCPDGTDVCVCSTALGGECVAATVVDTPWEWQANSTPHWDAALRSKPLWPLQPRRPQPAAASVRSATEPSVVSLNATGGACPLRPGASWRVWVGLRCDASYYGFATGTPTLASPAGCCAPPPPPVNGTAGRNHSGAPPLAEDPCAVVVDWRTSYVCKPFPSVQESRLVEMMPGGSRKPAPDQLAFKAGTSLDPPLGMQFRDQFRADGRPNSSRPAVLLQSNCSDDVLIAVCPSGRLDPSGSAALSLTSPAQAYGFQNTSCSVNVSMAASEGGGGPVPAWPGSGSGNGAFASHTGSAYAQLDAGADAFRAWLHEVASSVPAWPQAGSAGAGGGPPGGTSPRVCVGESASEWLLSSLGQLGALTLPPCSDALRGTGDARGAVSGSHAGRRGLGELPSLEQPVRRSLGMAIVPGVRACVSATSGAGAHAWAHVRFISATRGTSTEVGLILPAHPAWIGRHSDGRRPGAPFGLPVGLPPPSSGSSESRGADRIGPRQKAQPASEPDEPPAVALTRWGPRGNRKAAAPESSGQTRHSSLLSEPRRHSFGAPTPLPPGLVWMHAATAIVVVMPAPLGPQGPGGLSASELAAIVVGSVLGIAAVVGVGFAVRRNACARRGAFRLPTTWRRDATLDRARGLLEHDGTYVSRQNGTLRKGSSRGTKSMDAERAHVSGSLWDKQLGTKTGRGGGPGSVRLPGQLPGGYRAATGANPGWLSATSSMSTLGGQDAAAASVGDSTTGPARPGASRTRPGDGAAGRERRSRRGGAAVARGADHGVMQVALRGTGLDAHALEQQNILPLDDDDDFDDDSATADGASGSSSRLGSTEGAQRDLVGSQARQAAGPPSLVSQGSGSDNDVLSLE